MRARVLRANATRPLICVALVACFIPTAWAQSPDARDVDLTVRRAPTIMPASLGMRAARSCAAGEPCAERVALAPRSDDTESAPDESAPATPTTGPEVQQPRREPRPRRDERAVFGRRPLSEPVIFRFNVGVGLDGGEQRNPPEQLSGLLLDNYADLRVYYFGDAVIGSRGVLLPSLSTYLASSFRFNQATGFRNTAIPSVHDARGVDEVWIRSAYATWQEVSERSWLRPLYVRAGRQYRYGPAVAHFDGLTLGYETRALSVGLFTGRAVDVSGIPIGSLYSEEALLSGVDLRLDLFRLTRVPLSLTAEVLRFDATTHARGGLSLRLSRDIALGAHIRVRDTSVARTSARLRAQISKVTALRVTVENRSGKDWMYDIFSAEERDQVTLENLRLGPTLPRWYLDARAGTVLLSNIDLLVFGSAVALRDEDETPASSHTVSYVQAGGAIEVRLRRTLGLGVSLMTRRYQREDPDQVDDDDEPGTLVVDTDSAGEKTFVEGGASLRYTQGARRFSARAEGYARYYRWQSPYGDPEFFDTPLDPDLSTDVRLGGRFTVEGWAGENLRLKAEYDVSSTLVIAPALSGVKSLRVLAEGRF